MMIQAVLGNPHHPEYGVATIPFPIPRDQYTYCMDLLEALEVGDTVKADCKVVEFDSVYTVLKRMKALTVNVEELNYLVKRLESFDTGEAAQFQAMAHKLELFELKNLINLTFCCQQATVITDFSDLAAVGRDHYMNLHGGSASVDGLNKLDGEETARRLIENGSGKITPYGVVYDNGMKLEQVYDGRFFPCYYCLRCNPSPGDYNGYLACFNLNVQRQNMARDKPLVGRVTYANGDAQEFTDAEAFLKCVREELPYRPTTGFRYEVLTDDPSVRKQVDDMIFDFYGEEAPCRQEDHEPRPEQGMTFGGM